MRVDGSPRISLAGFIAILTQAKSPALIVADDCYRAFVDEGLDPAVALAFFMHESTYGTKGAARSSHNWGNIRPTRTGWLEKLGLHDGVYNSPDSGPFLLFRDREGEQDGGSWVRSALVWGRLISELYVHDWQLNEVRPILIQYAPGRDKNNPGGYADIVEETVTRWAEKFPPNPTEDEATRLRREIAEKEAELVSLWKRLIEIDPSAKRSDTSTSEAPTFLWEGSAGHS